MRSRTIPLLLILPLALAGCVGSSDPTPSTTTDSPTTTASPTDTSSPSPTPTEEPTPTRTPSLPTAPPAKTFPATVRDVGGIRWGGVSPLCGLWAMARLSSEVTDDSYLSAPVRHAGSPEAGYVCVGADWEETPATEDDPAYLWLSPESLVGVLTGPKIEGSAQVAAVRTVNANPNLTFADWSQGADGTNYTTLPGYPAVRVEKGWQPGITVFTVAYEGAGDGYQYFARFFDDPTERGYHRELLIAAQAVPDGATWYALFGEATAWSVVDLVTSSFRWRKGIDAPSNTPAHATWYDLYTNCTDPADAETVPCQAAFDPVVLPTLKPTS